MFWRPQWGFCRRTKVLHLPLSISPSLKLVPKGSKESHKRWKIKQKNQNIFAESGLEPELETESIQIKELMKVNGVTAIILFQMQRPGLYTLGSIINTYQSLQIGTNFVWYKSFFHARLKSVKESSSPVLSSLVPTRIIEPKVAPGQHWLSADWHWTNIERHGHALQHSVPAEDWHWAFRTGPSFPLLCPYFLHLHVFFSRKPGRPSVKPGSDVITRSYMIPEVTSLSHPGVFDTGLGHYLG